MRQIFEFPDKIVKNLKIESYPACYKIAVTILDLIPFFSWADGSRCAAAGLRL